MAGWPIGSRLNASEVFLLCLEYRSVLLSKLAEISYSALPEITPSGNTVLHFPSIPSILPSNTIAWSALVCFARNRLRLTSWDPSKGND
jgi:hypothetical protein